MVFRTSRKSNRSSSGGGGFFIPPITVSLSAASLSVGGANDTVIGALTVSPSDAILSLYDNDGGRFKISGGNLCAGTTTTTAPDGSTRQIYVRATWAGVPHDFPLTITLAAATVTDFLLNGKVGGSTINLALPAPNGTVVGTLTTLPPGVPGVTYTITVGTGSGGFAIVGNQLRTSASPPSAGTVALTIQAIVSAVPVATKTFNIVSA